MSIDRNLGLVVSLALAIGASAVPVLGQSAEIGPGRVSLAPDQVRQKIRAGQIRFGDCVTDTVDDTGTQPTIVFRNTCGVQVNVELCERLSADIEPNHYFIVLAPRSESRYRPWLKSGQTFDYTYNTCGANFCTPPDSDC